ncbi:MAG: hypothetical protein ACXWYO_09255 [Gaiellaceae bacterium]
MAGTRQTLEAILRERIAVLVIDVVGLGRGRVTVVLHTLTVRTPLPASVVNALTGVLASRLDAGHRITA